MANQKQSMSLLKESTYRRSLRSRESLLSLHTQRSKGINILCCMAHIKEMDKHNNIQYFYQLYISCVVFLTGWDPSPPRYRGLPSGPMIIPGSPFSPWTGHRVETCQYFMQFSLYCTENKIWIKLLPDLSCVSWLSRLSCISLWSHRPLQKKLWSV